MAAAVSFKLDLDGDEALRERLARLTELDKQQLLSALASEAEDLVKERVVTLREGAFSGAWPGWSRRYAASGRGRALLVQSGALRDSLQGFLSGDYGVVASNMEYAATHHYGDQSTATIGAHDRTITQAFGKPLAQPKTVRVKAHQKQRNIPARPYMELSATDTRQLLASARVMIDTLLGD